MAKVRLTEPHYLNNTYLEAGTIVEVPEHAMSISMEGLDDESSAAVDRHNQRALGQIGDHGTGGVNPQSLPDHPIVVKQADGTFGQPKIVQDAQDKKAEDAKGSKPIDIPETTKQDPARAKPTDAGKPVFPDLGSKK